MELHQENSINLCSILQALSVASWWCARFAARLFREVLFQWSCRTVARHCFPAMLLPEYYCTVLCEKKAGF